MHVMAVMTSLLDYVKRQQDHRINDGVVKWAMIYLLKAFDYLHSSGVVHTGRRLKFTGIWALADNPCNRHQT